MTAPQPITTPADLRRVMGTDFTFSDQQFAAISAPLEPAVVIAGAGSGKTEVMAARVVYLVATGQVRPEQVLGLTFTTKAAAELAARIRGSLRRAGLLRAPGALRSPEVPPDAAPEESTEPTVATYNSYAANLLTEHGLRIGHEPETRVVADASRYQLAARAIRRHTRPVLRLTDHLSTVIGQLLQLDGELSEHLVSPDRLRRWQAEERRAWQAAEPGSRGGRKGIDTVLDALEKREELLGLVEEYRALKEELGLMDFSDQISRGARLAMECPEVGRLERERYRVVLFDEYQDTSVAQAQMLAALFSDRSDPAGRGHPVTAVGDPNQAIYGWRGASVSNIAHFDDDFPPRHGAGSARPAYQLTVNRRSDRRILATANDLAATLYADERTGSARLEAKPEAAEGEVRAALLGTYDDELSFLADAVQAAYDGEAHLSWKDIGVLTRDNSHAADVYERLTRADIPVEIVGVNGLLRLPEVAEVVATLQLLQDLTANAALLTLLAGPRWAVGVRDLSLLGRRARQLAGQGHRAGRAEGESTGDLTVEEQLAAVVEAGDPADAVSLNDALDDPGPLPYSPEARERFALLSAELRSLRGYVGEPLLDLVRRIIDVTGIELELASSGGRTSASRRDNLDAFVQAVADFQSLDGHVSLSALLAYLEAEDELGNGLDAARPSVADSVKLLTVHRAKGLEWDVVFLPGLCETKFPNTQGRSQWVRAAGVLPSPLRGDARDLPQVEEHSEAALVGYAKAVKEHEQTEQLRLGYVAFTRARHRLTVSAHWWKSGRKKPLGPSPYLISAVTTMATWDAVPQPWTPPPVEGEENPVYQDTRIHPWPVEPDGDEVARRRRAAALVRAAMAGPADADRAGPEPELSPEERALVAAWDDEIHRLVEEARHARADVVEVSLPSSLSATALAQLRDDPGRFAATLARPMPRRPSPAARFGTRFHAWVESRFGQQQLVNLDDVPGRGDAEIDDADDLRELIERFNGGPFGQRTPFAVEPSFAIVLAGQVVRGRIDAVYETDGGFLVVDWKTSQQRTADRLQLAIYRVAWAELQDVPLEQVEAAFYYVRTGDLVELSPDDLPVREELERLLSGRGVSFAGTTRR